jgi:hypothetical protein
MMINSATARGIFSMTWDFATGKLYGGDGSGKHFFSIDPTTGVTTDIASNTTWQTLALAYDSGDNTIYGADAANGSGLFPRFYSINPANGAVTTIGGNSAQAIYGLAYLPSNDTLYGGNALNGKFFSIAPTTGAETIINGLTTRFVYAMAVPEPDGRVLGMIAVAGFSMLSFMRRRSSRTGPQGATAR